MQRGLSAELAHEVAVQLTAHDALGAHARDELGITDTMNAKPMQAAVASAATFAVGAVLPLLVTYFAPESNIANYVGATSLVFLAALGGLAAKAGGANITVGIARVAFWGVIAMAATAGVGKLFGVVTA